MLYVFIPYWYTSRCALSLTAYLVQQHNFLFCMITFHGALHSKERFCFHCGVGVGIRFHGKGD